MVAQHELMGVASDQPVDSMLCDCYILTHCDQFATDRRKNLNRFEYEQPSQIYDKPKLFAIPLALVT